jgi:apolipoprotein N-acyltransferase
VPLFLLVRGLPRGQRIKWGYFTGFLSFALINWWLIPTITRGAAVIGASPVMGFGLSIVAVAFIAAVHGLQPALVALLCARRPVVWLAVPLLWTALDWLRCQGPLAHSWGALGFSQVPDGPLLRTVASQHGLTLVCVSVSTCLALWWPGRRWYLAAAPGGLLLLLHLPLRGATSTPSPSKDRILVVQTNVSSLSKNGGTGESPFIQAYRLTQEAVSKARARREHIMLIVWPETTADLRTGPGNLYYGLDWSSWEREGPKIPLLMGAGVQDATGKRTNEAVLVLTEGTGGSYRKTRLVPFGERAPLVEYLPFLQVFAPNPALEPGNGSVPLLSAPQSGFVLAPQICFESCFPYPMKAAFEKAGVPEDQRLGVVITNDEWFAGTEAPRQHRNMSLLRAVENGVPLLQSANGGYSFVADASGRVLAGSSYGEAQVLDAPYPRKNSGAVAN